jgi:hypothetical protein
MRLRAARQARSNNKEVGMGVRVARSIVTVVVVCTLAGGQIVAQGGTGTLLGTVVGPDGAPMQGVKVTLGGGGGPSVEATTRSDGTFTFLNATAGERVVTAEFADYEPAETPVRVRVGQTVSLEITMAFGGVGENVTVVVREQAGGRHASVHDGRSASDIDKLPATRDPWALLQQVPGVLTDRINVGGNESGQQNVVTGDGGTSEQAVWSLDGVNITDMTALGSTPAYYDFDSFEEFAVSTGDVDPQTGRSSGSEITIRTPTGANEFHGSALLETDLRNFNRNDTRQRPFGGGNTLDDILGYTAALGGPINRDRVWFFGSYGTERVDQTGLSAGDAVSRDVTLDSYVAKVSWHTTQEQMLAAWVHLGTYRRKGEGVSGDRAPDATWTQDGQLAIYAAEYRLTPGDRFAILGTVARVENEFDLVPQGGVEATPFLDRNDVYQNSFVEFVTDRPSTEYKLDGSNFFDTGALSHELKFGTGYRQFVDDTAAHWATDTLVRDDGGTSLVAFFPAGSELSSANSYAWAYAWDTLRAGKLTGSAGLRFDLQHGTNRRSSATANPLRPTAVPGATFAGADAPFEWEQISPRLGVTFAPTTSMTLSTSYGRFTDLLSTALTRLTNPIPGPGSSIGSEALRFIDLNGNRRFDPNEPQSASIINGTSTGDPRFLDVRNQVAADLEAPVTSVFNAAFDQRIGRTTTIRFDFTRRSTTGVIDSIDLVQSASGATTPVTAANYVAGPTWSGRDVDGAPVDVPTLQLGPGVTFTGGDLVTNGARERRYTGATVQVDHRFNGTGFVAGWLQLGDSDWEVPSSFFADANDLLGPEDEDGSLPAVRSISSQKRMVFINSEWSYAVQGFVPLPGGVGAAVKVYGRQGYPQPQFATVAADGRRREIQVGRFGERRLDDVHVVDARVAKTFTIGGVGVTVGADVFNLFDRDTVLQRNGDVLSSRSGQIEERLGARVVKIGARVRF